MGLNLKIKAQKSKFGYPPSGDDLYNFEFCIVILHFDFLYLNLKTARGAVLEFI